jgi:nitrogen regulatory protein P-II 1
MRHQKVTAFIRNDQLEKVEKALLESGVKGMSITTVKGYGEYADYYARDLMIKHERIEIFCSEEQAEVIAKTIIETAFTGMEGDGIVAILPVEKLYRIRTKSPLEYS